MFPRLRLLINRTMQVDRTFSRFPRRSIFPGFGFLALGMIVLSACGAGGGASTVYGVADPDLITQSAAVQVEQLTAIKAVGATSVRFEASWYWGQPDGPGSFDWGVLDQAIASARQVGLQ